LIEAKRGKVWTYVNASSIVSSKVYFLMASILRRPRSKYWHAFFRDSSGKAFCRSTKLTTRREAQKVADLWEITAQKKKSAQHIRSVFTSLFQEVYGESMPVASLKKFVGTWLEQKKPETSAATYLAYQKTTDSFMEALGPEKADKDLSEVTRADIVKFRNDRAQHLSGTTVNRYVKILRMVFKAAHRDGYVLENPAEHVEILKNGKQGSKGTAGRRPFTIPEIQAVLSIADPEWKSLIKFGLYTGQRLGDLALLTWENIDLERNELRLVTRKTGKNLTIPISSPLQAHIMSLKDSLDGPGTKPLHPESFETIERQGRAVSLSNQFADLLGQAGLRKKKDHQSHGIGRNAKRAGSTLSFHSLRHTSVSLLKDAGIPQAVVQELIGHDSEAMSQLYTHVGVEALRKAAASLPVL
jgi:integrase